MTLSLTVTSELDFEAPVEHARLELAAACALEAADYPPESADDGDEIEVSLCLVDRTASAQLNNAYRGKNYATNVLSFPADAQVPGLVALGDLVICLPVVEEEAAAQHKSVGDHLLHLVVHGTLHLLGFDHVGDAEADSMEAMERRVLAGFGIGDPYAPTSDADRTD
ncbi:rRNA maturation RNase YbeY [Salinisphaera sp. USBA-960]|uniref:rRNA maturation RNase YbeY n=1 Tax=Salinisphaera orenii TaxID=856731 RepID=UPI000DBEA158|nr:rRNA maturation RNase YbeY [Salifodinibacter halophilus]NNC27175.1 rRNA maturation RNase YbeY [Salifodinibacter halophilus]